MDSGGLIQIILYIYIRGFLSLDIYRYYIFHSYVVIRTRVERIQILSDHRRTAITERYHERVKRSKYILRDHILLLLMYKL